MNGKEFEETVSLNYMNRINEGKNKGYKTIHKKNS